MEYRERGPLNVSAPSLQYSITPTFHFFSLPLTRRKL